ncbi:MAG: iron-containing alcohol dehydrogenase [Actinobacteria bacterium]|nr:iron-containing alcohol dehydrogenase [Actinomycetota bacterium]
MENFIFQNITKIIFGHGAEKNAGTETKKYSDKVLLHYGGGSIKKSGLYENIIKYLHEEKIGIIELAGVEPNPKLSLIKKGIEICRKNSIGFILAVGGGSVIDSAKAISVGVPYNGDIWDFFGGKAKAKTSIPLGVILTISGSGSEASDVSVVTNEEILIKRGYHNKLMLPKFAILNPELSFTVNPFQTASGAADAMSHIMERYFTQVKKADLTDRLCESCLITVMENLKVALENPKDYDARAELMWSAAIAHNGLLGTGRIEDWGSHKLAHELSSYYGVSHGAATAIIFPAWMKYVYKYNTGRFVQFAFRVFGIDPCFGSQEQIAMEGIKRLEKFYKEAGLPVTLEKMNIGSEKIDEMSAKCVLFGDIGNFIKLNKNDVISIFNLANPI